MVLIFNQQNKNCFIKKKLFKTILHLICKILELHLLTLIRIKSNHFRWNCCCCYYERQVKRNWLYAFINEFYYIFFVFVVLFYSLFSKLKAVRITIPNSSTIWLMRKEISISICSRMKRNKEFKTKRIKREEKEKKNYEHTNRQTFISIQC